jgi:hypothetical protein
MTNEIETANELYTPVPAQEVDLSSFATTRAKILYLHSIGKKKSEISKLVKDKNGLNLRFQHVYNTIKDFEVRGK